MSRIAFLAGLLAVAVISPAGAQHLGLWQDRVGEGISYGEPGRSVAIRAADPVRALPIAARPVAPPVRRPTATVAVKAPAETVALGNGQPDGPVGNFLSRPYDADVPLPHPDLAGMEVPSRRSTKPHPFVRGEQGGGVFGLTVPLPADRVSITSESTRSGSGAAAP